jgi:L-alanine-DL-glutamate epimerase-like enolase superfamily enzyme
MDRRSFLKSLSVAPAAATLLRPSRAEAALPKAKITRVRIYKPPNLNELFNQSTMVCTVETDIGITGIGEGGSKDTLEQCAGTLIGQNPFRIEAIWQEMYIAWFYPPGREKVHALGALDLALWDIKGKALGLPVHELLGGAVRNHCECYATGGGGRGAAGGQPMSLRERA